MTILFSILGIHLLNVFFVFFNVARTATKCGIKGAYNMRYLLWLFCHPLLNILAVVSLIISGEEGLAAICKKKMEEE